MSFYNDLIRAFSKEKIQHLEGVRVGGQPLMSIQNSSRFPLLFHLAFIAFIKSSLILSRILNPVIGKLNHFGNRL
jgi:hypothetical protein